MKKSIMDTY